MKFYKRLLALVLPITMQNLLSALVSASDALMLGLLNQEALSAVSLATQVQFVLNLFYAALTIGATVLAAQYWGKGDSKSVEQVLAIALKMSMFVSLLFFFAASLVPGSLMRIFTNENALIGLGEEYLRKVSWSYLFAGVSQIYLCIMKNSGRTLRSTIYGSAAVIINIVLNAVFIFGLFGVPKMGIAGAAVATVISRAIELLLVLAENRKKDRVRIRLKLLLSGSKRLKCDFYRYTFPVLANELVWGCGFTMFSVIMGHLGNDAVAANSIANIVKNIIACMCLGIGTGSGILVGNELGKGDLKQAKEYGARLCRVSLAAGIVSGLLLLISGTVIMRFTNLSSQAQEYLRLMLYVCSYYLVGKSINSTVIAGIFCAGGDTKFGLLCDTVTMWLIIVPAGMLAAFAFKLPVMAVYFLLNLDELIKLPAVYRHYKRYKWLNNLTTDTL
ncbi:MAG: MATE family efflux transporter [Eubacteriales bacterium]|nr:MATE family efflux transporter [Eubacteriales bacterium]